MARYTIRVVLHDNATWEDYANLKTRLALQGVVDYIQSDSGEWWRLPPAEYTYSGSEDGLAVRQAVSNVAGAIKRSAVFVTTAGDQFWMGLEQLNGPG